MGSKKTKTTKQETATTRPDLPEWAAPVVQNYYGGVGNLLSSDWSPYTAPNSILNNVFANAGNLSPGSGFISEAADATRRYVNGTTPWVSAPEMSRASLGDPTKVDLSGLLGGYSPARAEDVANAIGAGAQAGRAIDYLDDYKPYANEALVRRTMASFDDQADRQTAAYNAAAAGRGAFGGSRVAIGEAQLASDIARNAGLTRAQMEDAALTRALGAAAGDAGNVTQANIASANNATGASIANNRTGADLSIANAGYANDFLRTALQGGIDAALANAGYANDFGLARYDADNYANNLSYTTEADIANANANRQLDFDRLGLDAANNLGLLGVAQNEQARADAAAQMDIGQLLYEIENNANLAPAQKLQIINELLTGGGLLGTVTGQTINSNSNSTTKESGGLIGDLIGAAAKLGSAAISKSDRRVKRDIVELTREPDGLGWYNFNYVWDDADEPVRTGVMAQEVAELRPWALGPLDGDTMTVDYSKLDKRP